MYRLIDCGNFQKLEQVGPWRLVRPAAQAVWRPRLGEQEWQNVDAVYTRFSGGDGKWTIKNKKLPERWTIDIDSIGKLVIRMTEFGHLGIFPEQHTNWKRMADIVRKRVAAGSAQNVLNLFAYTGGSTLACANAGANVVHLDASKTSVAWGRENAEASGLTDRPVRWIVDDVQKFVDREVRRESKYHGIILDPPSYGRGAKGETWDIETMLPGLLDELKKILADDFSFILLSSHSNGYTPQALTNLLSEIVPGQAGEFLAEEMVVQEDGSKRVLPSGACCFFIRNS